MKCPRCGSESIKRGEVVFITPETKTIGWSDRTVVKVSVIGAE